LPAATKVVNKIWEKYLQGLCSGKVTELPESVMDLRSTLLKELEEVDRNEIWPIWTDEMSSVLQTAVDKLSENQKTVIQYYCGINSQKPLTLLEIGTLLEVSRERIHQIEMEAIRNLRRSSEVVSLNLQMCPFSELAPGRQKDAEEIDRLQKELEKAGEKIDWLSARVIDTDEAIECGYEEELNKNLFKPIEDLDLSIRSANCLQNAGIEYIYQLVEKTELEMIKTKNFGRKSLNEIKEILAEMNLNLGMRLPKHLRPPEKSPE